MLLEYFKLSKIQNNTLTIKKNEKLCPFSKLHIPIAIYIIFFIYYLY